MPLPLIIGGAAAAIGTAIAAKKLFKKDQLYYIKNSHSMYFNGIIEKRFLFIKYKKTQWVTHWDNAEGFNDEEEANDCIQQNRFRNVEIISKEC